MRKCILFLLAFCMSNSVFTQETAPSHIKKHQSYKYKSSIEQLGEKYSKKMISEAQKEMKDLNEVNFLGKYKPILDSLDQHETPEWYIDAKLGIFFDWGPYSIAGYAEKGWSRARYPDWYLHNMYTSYINYHEKTWGEDFHRDDFIPLFTADNFNVKEIIDLTKSSGAKYFVPFNKHHDGYCLWNSSFTQRDAVDMFPGHDISAELVEECEKQGLYHGFYFSVEDYEYPMFNQKNELVIRTWSDGSTPDDIGPDGIPNEKTTAFKPEFHNRILSGKIPVYNFIDEYLVPQAKEFIDKYDPDILWFDGEWHRPATYYKTPEIVAYFYNMAEGRKEVVANDRLGKGTRGVNGDFYTSETDEVTEKMDFPWEENRSMSESYGYSKTDSLENYLTPDELIEMFVRIVAKGGNLNLMVNPEGSGEIPELQKNLLKELGDWLKVNGEAIYNTRPYEVVCDNTQLGQPVWYTKSKDEKYAYAICLNWPKSETFICTEANMKWETNVYMLGYEEPLEWVDTKRDKWALSARIPEKMIKDKKNRPCKYAWVLKFEYDKNNEF